MPSGRWNARHDAERRVVAPRAGRTTRRSWRGRSARACRMNSGPLSASRHAAVAITHTRSTCMVSHSVRNRLQRGERLLDRVRRQQAGRLHLAAEAGQHLFVEDRRRAARQPFVGDEPHRVRPDIDDGDRRPVVEPALRGAGCPRVCPFVSGTVNLGESGCGATTP